MKTKQALRTAHNDEPLNKETIRLNTRIENLQQKLFEVNEKLIASEQLKSHFLSKITNEIVNPFAAILGLSTNIAKLENHQMERAKQMARMIYSEASTLNFQLKNIFAATELEAGEMYPEMATVNIKQICSDVIRQFEAEASTKALKIIMRYQSFTNSSDYHIYSDPEKLSLVFSNLLSNAIKYAAPNTAVDIELIVKKNKLIISMADEGPGINQEDQKEIFNRFNQLDSEINSVNKGYGLGLSVAKAILELMNGSIDIQSHSDTGSRFIIQLPLPDSTLHLADEDLLDNDGLF